MQADPQARRIADPYVATYVYVDNQPTVFGDPSGRGLDDLLNEVLDPLADVSFGTARLIGLGGEIGAAGTAAIAYGGGAALAAGIPLAVTGLAIAGLGVYYALEE